MLPFYIAAEEGYFAEQRLDVEFRTAARNQDVMAPLAQGAIDVAAGMVTVNELGLGVAGARLRLVTSVVELSPGGCSYVAAVVRKAVADSGALTDPEQVRALRYDINPLLPFGYFLDGLLAPLQVTSAELNALDIPPTAALEALQRGEIDVSMDSEPFVMRHTAAGHAVVWGSFPALFPGYPISMVMYGPSLLDDRPDVGNRFATAMLKAMRQAARGRTPENLALVERELGLPPELASSVCWPSFTPTGRMDASALDGFQQWSVAHGLVDRVLADDELFDHRFIEYANAELAP